jgi:DNA primase
MRISEEDINQIRERNDLVEIVSQYATLKKAGRTFKALCPFHREKTPSFVIDPAKQLYHCFGCSQGGNVFTFLMKIDNLDFPDAVRMLAERVGYRFHWEEETRQPSRRQRLLDANQEALRFYHDLLFKLPEAALARSYLKGRGFTETTARTFRLGYAPNRWDALISRLHNKGFSTSELEAAGLIVKGERGASHYDRFRNRIVFPILDLRGRCIAFGGRIIEEGNPKYLNSSETPVFQKGSNLYGLFHAKSETVRTGQAVVVEGYTDVLAMHQAGIKYTVATLGTALTAEHLSLLARFTDRVVLVFDADTAGLAAAERGFGLLGEAKVELYVMSLPAGTDPADFTFSAGREEFESAISSALPLVDFCLNQMVGRYNLKESAGKIKAAREALSLIRSLPSPIAREEYLRKLSERLTVSYESLLGEIGKTRGRKTSSLDKVVISGTLDAQGRAEQEVLKLILHDPELAQEAVQELGPEDFMTDNHRELFAVLSTFFQGKNSYRAADLLSAVTDEAQRNLISKLVFDNIVVEDAAKYFQDILRKLKEFGLERQILIVKSKLERLNPTKDTVGYDALFEQLLQLEALRRDLKEKKL